MGRRFRIAVSVSCEVLAVCVLWVRSYDYLDVFLFPVSISRSVTVASANGLATISTRLHFLGTRPSWQLNSMPLEAITVESENCDVVIRYPLMAIVCVGLAASSWFLRGRQFSLRTLLMVTIFLPWCWGSRCGREVFSSTKEL